MPVAHITGSGVIAIPAKQYQPDWTIQITRDDGTVDTVTTDTISAQVTGLATDGVFSANIVLDNRLGAYLNLYNGGEEVVISAGYSGDTLTTIFRGTVDSISYNLSIQTGYTVSISCRNAVQFLDRTVVKEYADRQLSDIITNSSDGLIQLFTTGFSVSNVTTNTTNTTINWRHKTVWDALRDLADIVDYDFFVDTSKDLNFFAKNSRYNTTEAVIVGDNLISVNTGIDSIDVKNKVIVYGSLSGDIPLIRTKEDATSQTNYGVKELVISDTALATRAQVLDKATAQLALLKEPPTKGTVEVVGMPSITPGQNIRIYCPYVGLDGYYKIVEFTHNLSKTGGFVTTLVFARRAVDIADLFKTQIVEAQGLRSVSNKNGMENSFVMIFTGTEDIATISNAEVSNQGLILSAAAPASGNFESNNFTADKNFTQVELRATQNSDADQAVTYFVSNDGGANYVSISLNTPITLTTVGRTLKIKGILSSTTTYTTPKIYSVGALFK